MFGFLVLAWSCTAITIVEKSCNKWRDRLDHAASEVTAIANKAHRRLGTLDPAAAALFDVLYGKGRSPNDEIGSSFDLINNQSQ